VVVAARMGVLIAAAARRRNATLQHGGRGKPRRCGWQIAPCASPSRLHFTRVLFIPCCPCVQGSDTVVDAEAELAPVLPERVYVKVGASNKYLSMAHAKQKVGLMDEGDFLRALHADPVFKGLIRGVDHSLVATRVVKGPLPSTTFPTAAHEADGVTIALSEGVTIAEAAASADTGAHLFVRVHAPAAADSECSCQCEMLAASSLVRARHVCQLCQFA